MFEYVSKYDFMLICLGKQISFKKTIKLAYGIQIRQFRLVRNAYRQDLCCIIFIIYPSNALILKCFIDIIYSSILISVIKFRSIYKFSIGTYQSQYFANHSYDCIHPYTHTIGPEYVLINKQIQCHNFYQLLLYA